MGQAHIEGLFIANKEGDVVYAQGRATDTQIAELLRDKQWRSEAMRRRLMPLAVSGWKGVVLWTRLDKLDVGVVVGAIGDAVFEFTAAVDFAWDIINHLLTDPYDAMTVVDADAHIVFLAPVHEKFFGLDRGAAIGQPVKSVIENTRLDQVAKSGKAEIGDVQHMRGQDRIVSRIPIFRDQELVGAIGQVMFKSPDQVEALNKRVNALEKQLAYYKREADVLRRETTNLDAIVGESQAVKHLKEDIVRVAPLDIPVLILGESGTGKELVAHAIHRLSPRHSEKMVIVNSAALPSTLVESELFGYEAGSFTGADRKGRRGKFEQADGSSLFLDEVGDMPLDIQAKLLRVLQDGAVQRVGGDVPHQVDFRLIAATNRDLSSLMVQERFRLDFYYRISPIILKVPPLRERLEDIPVLLNKFLSEFGRRHQMKVPNVDDEVYEHLRQQQWPGNIRQLRHEMERAIIFATGNRLRISDFRRSEPAAANNIGLDGYNNSEKAGNLQNAIAEVEDSLIRQALVRFKGNKKRVAEELGISRSYLYKKLGAT